MEVQGEIDAGQHDTETNWRTHEPDYVKTGNRRRKDTAIKDPAGKSNFYHIIIGILNNKSPMFKWRKVHTTRTRVKESYVFLYGVGKDKED